MSHITSKDFPAYAKLVDRAQLHPTAQLLALKIFSYVVSASDGNCSVKRLAESARVCERTIKRHLATLTKKGIIRARQDKWLNSGKFRWNHYQLPCLDSGIPWTELSDRGTPLSHDTSSLIQIEGKIRRREYSQKDRL
ncbi:helix-turn-helix domain-containing protein [Candidatus Rariloculus sp.]|uniref:helix-turn-helix domain-containing protein n=1 Tax=Candidatus Rariloculus sp. TaxID=3101265 RepID=UPI003D0B3223